MTQAQTPSAKADSATATVTRLADANQDPLLAMVLEHLDDDQAHDVVTIPLEGKSSIADFMVIASGRSTRQVAAMAQKLAEKIKHAGRGPVKLEGLPAADWVLVDAGDVIVHLFRPEVRSFYNLERMWAFGDAPPVAGTA
ncbi:ribosome silencing factor [Qipengyuania marisflavi]|uniref:Ribosomal silencing factor RsfS n=1 Tax=Qipengyuania marisflavi TaxID=2486356 RepID=A0A5S3P5D3_9SPHN|nr:ribosome silencing factor [Qipengyuania marisflavi]TMM48164.1 ribosome silencing factor [Qipengyuania marisflavi]